MIGLYCRLKHSQKTLCEDCRNLENYAHDRLERCPFGEKKPVCKKCSIHCYTFEQRKKIKKVMRFSGSRMVFFSPREMFEHFLRNRRSNFLSENNKK